MSKFLASIFKKDEIEEALTKINDDIEDLAKVDKKTDQKTLVILANDDKISAYGENFRFGRIHHLFGIQVVNQNIKAFTHEINVSFEYVTEMDSDVLHVIEGSDSYSERTCSEIHRR